MNRSIYPSGSRSTEKTDATFRSRGAAIAIAWNNLPTRLPIPIVPPAKEAIRPVELLVWAVSPYGNHDFTKQYLILVASRKETWRWVSSMHVRVDSNSKLTTRDYPLPGTPPPLQTAQIFIRGSAQLPSSMPHQSLLLTRSVSWWWFGFLCCIDASFAWGERQKCRGSSIDWSRGGRCCPNHTGNVFLRSRRIPPDNPTRRP